MTYVNIFSNVQDMTNAFTQKAITNFFNQHCILGLILKQFFLDFLVWRGADHMLNLESFSVQYIFALIFSLLFVL